MSFDVHPLGRRNLVNMSDSIICESSLQNKQVQINKKYLLLKCKPLNACFKMHAALKKIFQIKIIGMNFYST